VKLEGPQRHRRQCLVDTVESPSHQGAGLPPDDALNLVEHQGIHGNSLHGCCISKAGPHGRPLYDAEPKTPREVFLFQADVADEVDVEFCAAAAPDPLLPFAEFADDEVVVDVCALAAGEPALLEFAEDEVDVDVCADELPAPESPAAVLAFADVEVEVCAPGDEGVGVVTAAGFVAVLPAVVAEVVPVVVCAVEPPDPAWVPVEVVVPVWALEVPAPACVPVDVVVPAWPLELPASAWLPVDVVVLV
jgi:hypothetical protein